MTSGDNADFDSAWQAWQRALDAAEKMCQEGGEESFFPNRFYSMQDLKIEQYFLGAAKAFQERKWTDCMSLLENWREECPQEYLWSWRSINVYIRLLGTKIINAIMARNIGELPTLCANLKNISQSEPIGSAAQYFVGEILHLQEKRNDEQFFNFVLASLARYFPLDSYVDSYQQPDRIDKFASLPKKIHDSLVISPLPSTETEVERLKALIIGGIEAFLGYMCDYYAQASFPIDIVPDYGIQNLIVRCRQLPFGWAQRPMFQNLVETLLSATDKMTSAKSTEEFSVAYDEIRVALLGLKRFIPVVVNISSTKLRTEEPIALEAFPDWALDLVGRRVIFIFVRPETLPSINSGNYYLRPAWRRGNRLSYPESDKLRLLPVRYIPRWEFWEKEIQERIRISDLQNRIKLGETDLLEFKSILRPCENKILKTIAAFCNTMGGELLIGVNDDGTVCGIEIDRFSDNDAFMLRLGEIITQRLKPCLVNFVKYAMVNLEGKWICHVQCMASTEEVWLKDKDTYRFYVRSGNSSIELPGPEVGKYRLTRN